MGAAGVGTSREYAGNAKSKRLSLSPDVNAIFAINFRGSAGVSMRASKKAPFFASTSGADASSRVLPVFGSNVSLVTTRPRTFRASAMLSGLEKSSYTYTRNRPAAGYAPSR